MDAVSESAKILRLDERDYSEVSKGFTSFKNDDVIVAKITPCFENGKGAYLEGLRNGVGFGSTEFHVIRAGYKADARFLFYLTRTSEFRVRGERNMQGSAGQKRVTTDYIKLYKVLTPPLPEQKKIAQILSTWDNAISATERLLENSQQRKKALMQQLLTGKKRLPGYGREWSYHYLTDVAEVIVSPVDKKTIDGEVSVELCNYTDVYYNHKITRSLKFMKATAKPSEIEKYTLKINDVIITKDSETPGDIAVPALVYEDLKGVVCGYHLAIVRPSPEILSGAFLNYLFSMPKTRYYFFTLATGATRFGLSVGGINKAYFQFPPLDEQQAIANVLTTADQEIDALQKRLDHLKQEKKALMQQLLTGKRRVQVDDAA
jgi:type I restriction enzyme S subunit